MVIPGWISAVGGIVRDIARSIRGRGIGSIFVCPKCGAPHRIVTPGKRPLARCEQCSRAYHMMQMRGGRLLDLLLTETRELSQ